MPKNSKHRNPKQKKPRHKKSANNNAVEIKTPMRHIGEMGIFDRHYPSAVERKGVIGKIRQKVSDTRTSDEWWMLGEYLIFNGLMDEDDSNINEGVQALTQGANLPIPSPACLLDLGWILMFRGLDSMALPYLQQAVELVPTSRDAWSLKALCHVGNGQREQAIDAYRMAVTLPNSTDFDKQQLSDLESGKDLKVIRRTTLFRKIEPQTIGQGHLSVEEQAKFTVHFIKPLLEETPTHPELLYSLAHARYTLGQYDKAKPLLAQLLVLSGGHAAAYTMLGLIVKKTAEDTAAERDYYKKALEVDPDHLLALVNLASSLQDEGDFHVARPLLQRALDGDPSDPNYPIALDLYGSNIGSIDEDFETEAELHERAARIAPKKHMFRANQVVALLSAGRTKDARSVFMQHKDALQQLANFNILSGLVDAYTRDLGHPYPYMQIIESTQHLLGWKAMRPLIRKAWALRARIRSDNHQMLDFYNHIGMMAGRAGDTELALVIWDQGARLPGGELMLCNKAVELSHNGRHAEALATAESMPMTVPRSYTILGNIRKSAGQLLAAVSAYRDALTHDERFLLPISNAVDCITELRQPDLLPPFVEALEQHWLDNQEAALIRAHALLLEGCPADAAEAYAEILINDTGIVSPESLAALCNKNPDDLSLWRAHGTEHHKLFAKALIWSGCHAEFESLYRDVMSWPKWADGDWQVLMAESLRRQGKQDASIDIVTNMTPQPPSLITSALCHLEQGDYEAAAQEATAALTYNKSPEGYFHIEGRPNSLATAIQALCELHEGHLSEAKRLASTAVGMDIGCSFARTALASVYLENKNPTSAIQTLQEGLRRSPGQPSMIRLAIEILVEQDMLEDADQLLAVHRNLVQEFGVTGLAERLGELIALRRLEKATQLDIRLRAVHLDWANRLDPLSQSWLASAVAIQRSNADLSEAFILYLSKVAEHILASHLFVPFCDSLPNKDGYYFEQLEDLSRFIGGGRQPALGGMIKALLMANRPFRSNDAPLVKLLRNYVRGLPQTARAILQQDEFLNRLRSLANIRNSVAHTGSPNIQDFHSVSTLVLDGERPGDLLRAFVTELQD